NAHGLSTGDEVVYHDGGGSNQSVGGMADGNTYYVIKINDFTIQLASTRGNATSGNADVSFTFSQATGKRHSLTPIRTAPNSNLPFDSSGVTPLASAAPDQIQINSVPGWHTGDAVVYHNGGGTNQSIGGLADGHTYYIIKLDDTHLKLAATLHDAGNNQPAFLTSTTGNGTNNRLIFNLNHGTVGGQTGPLP